MATDRPDCSVIAVGIDPDTGDVAQLIDTRCMAPPDGVAEHAAADGSRYWCRPFGRKERDDAE